MLITHFMNELYLVAKPNAKQQVKFHELTKAKRSSYWFNEEQLSCSQIDAKNSNSVGAVQFHCFEKGVTARFLIRVQTNVLRFMLVDDQLQADYCSLGSLKNTWSKSR